MRPIALRIAPPKARCVLGRARARHPDDMDMDINRVDSQGNREKHRDPAEKGCWQCGIEGHQRRNCPERKNGNRGLFKRNEAKKSPNSNQSRIRQLSEVLTSFSQDKMDDLIKNGPTPQSQSRRIGFSLTPVRFMRTQEHNVPERGNEDQLPPLTRLEQHENWRKHTAFVVASNSPMQMDRRISITSRDTRKNHPGQSTPRHRVHKELHQLVVRAKQQAQHQNILRSLTRLQRRLHSQRVGHELC